MGYFYSRTQVVFCTCPYRCRRNKSYRSLTFVGFTGGGHLIYLPNFTKVHYSMMCRYAFLLDDHVC